MKIYSVECRIHPTLGVAGAVFVFSRHPYPLLSRCDLIAIFASQEDIDKTIANPGAFVAKVNEMLS